MTLFVKLFETFLARLASFLPFDSRAMFREKFRVVGALDYPKARIFMSVSSRKEARRLSACKKEPETISWLERHLKAGDVLYDIGANVGAYSFVANKICGGNILVYAFEPGFANFASLSANVILNGCQGKVIPFNVALGAETKLLNLNYSSIVPGAARHVLGDQIATWKPGFQVGSFQPVLNYGLDDFIDTFSLKKPNHLKIDVDGGEAEVVVGSSRTLKDLNLKSLLIEIDESLANHSKIINTVESSGFKLESKHPRGKKVFNYIFVRKE